MATLFYQRLKPRHIDRAYHYNTVGENDGVQSVVPLKSPRRGFPLAELPDNGLPTELIRNRHDGTAELPRWVGGLEIYSEFMSTWSEVT